MKVSFKEHASHSANNPSRRQFLILSSTAVVGASLTGSLVIGFSTRGEAVLNGPEINAWVVVQPDEKVIVRIVRCEMGQGTHTGLAQLIVEELDADWANVSLEFPTAGESLKRDHVWGKYGTFGSRGIRNSQDYVRKGGAAAREMLLRAAANDWNVPINECHVAKGIVTHTASGRKTTYGKLAPAAARLDPPASPTLKDHKDWTIVGRRLARLDTREKVDGSLKFSMDYDAPGLLHAAIRQSPTFGGVVKSYDASKVTGMPGVIEVVPVGDDAIAVVARTWWRAKNALDALPIEFDRGINGSVQGSDIKEMLESGLEADDGVVGNANGNAVDALNNSHKTVEATYSFPYQAHATMEPLNATALWTEERCEVWTSTQDALRSHNTVVEAAGLSPEKCEVYNMPLGGGFGRRGIFQDYVKQAVIIARAIPGRPIKLLWSREEDMTHDHYHPTTMCRVSAGLDDSGKIDAIKMRISGQSIHAAVFPNNIVNGRDPIIFEGLHEGLEEHSQLGYSFPNLLIEHAMRNPHVPPGFWRGVNLNQNTFYMESFIDEIAFASDKDPLDLRRQLLKNSPKHLAVLNAVAERVGWDQPAADIDSQKVFRGLAVTHGLGSYVAACAEVSVDEAGRLKIHRLVGATDCGYAVNPRQIEAQIEGSFVYGLSAALFGECTVANGAIEQTNFHDYEIMKMEHMPKVESIIMPSGGFWGGAGETTIAVAAPAALNAVFAATGKRIRDLPLRNQLVG